MGRMNARALLVGSVPGDDAEQVMRLVGGQAGDLLGALPDGETGYRRIWINFLAYRTYHPHPDLETVNRPHPVEPGAAGEWRQPGDDWVPKGYDDHWLFAVRDGAPALRFEALGYAGEARASYRTFCRLRDEGAIPDDLRFQVSLPMTESATRPFVRDAADFGAFCSAYRDAVCREVDAICEAIPPSDLSIQWDVCMEVLAAAVGDGHPDLFRWRAEGDPLERYAADLATLSARVPGEAWMGLHLCYGDLGHRHFVEPENLSLVVDMANRGRRASVRPVDFYHVPVPRDRDDDGYFAPLADLDIGDGRLFLGLVHVTGGVDATLRRLATARRHAADFGIATECGFGRRPAAQIPELLDIHRAAATA